MKGKGKGYGWVALLLRKVLDTVEIVVKVETVKRKEKRENRKKEYFCSHSWIFPFLANLPLSLYEE